MTQNVYEKILVAKTDMDGALSIFLRHIHDEKKRELRSTKSG